MWHAYAKLRIHTETTIKSFKAVTTSVGQSLHHFVKNTCAAFETYELPSEEAACGWRKAAMAKKQGGRSGVNPDAPRVEPSTSVKKHVQKMLSLSTYKLHALGDYASTIEYYGTTDNYTTQTVSNYIQRVQRVFHTDLLSGRARA
jgi:hypothetical protein